MYAFRPPPDSTRRSAFTREQLAVGDEGHDAPLKLMLRDLGNHRGGKILPLGQPSNLPTVKRKGSQHPYVVDEAGREGVVGVIGARRPPIRRKS